MKMMTDRIEEEKVIPKSNGSMIWQPADTI